MTELDGTATLLPPQDVSTRIDALHALFGDPLDETNPVGDAAVLAADERGELLAAGEDLLSGFGLNAEFVPAALGGRLVAADELVAVMRAVFRRDCALGIGYGVTNLIGGLPVWTSGDERHHKAAAELLLRGGRIAAAYTELPHGSDFSRHELTAYPSTDSPGTLLLHGGKQLVNNIGRAEAAVVFARTDDAAGSRSHSHLFVELPGLPGMSRGQRFRTSGVRGVRLGGITFDATPVPATSVVGQPGGAMETVLRAFQVTRSVLPGMTIGIADTQLRTVLRFALGRTVYGRAVSDLPHARATLSGALLDLVAADALATAGARSLHLTPDQTSVHSAAVKYLVPTLLRDVSYQLSVLLGARSYLRTGPQAIFGKMARDLPVVSLAHAGSAVCLATIVPQLPRLAGHSWLRAEPPSAALFGTEPLPALDFGALEINARGRDTLAAALTFAAVDPKLAPLADLFTGELSRLATACAELPPRDRTVVARRPAFRLAARYATVLAAAATCGMWRVGRLATPLAAGALHRLADRLALHPAPLPPEFTEAVYAELLARYEGARTFDLADRPVP